MYILEFRETISVADLTKKLQWWLDQYCFFTAPVCIVGSGLCFGHEWPISASGDVMGVILCEFLPTLVVAWILWLAIQYRYRLSDKVIATHKNMFNETLTTRGCPVWLILVAAAVAFLVLTKKSFFTPVLIAILPAVGWILMVLLELGGYLLCMKIYQIINGDKSTYSSPKPDIVEPEWYTRKQKNQGKPIVRESPKRRYYVPSGKISFKADAANLSVYVIIEMKEVSPPKEDS